MPSLPDYPDGAAWAVLPAKLAAGLRDFRSELKESVWAIEFTDEVVGPPEAIDTASHNYIIMGYTAIKLADGLRKHYRLGPYQSTGEEGFIDDLRKRYREVRLGPLRRLWRSLPVKRARRWFLRRWRRLIRLSEYIKIRKLDD
jgi:hypothetical protein